MYKILAVCCVALGLVAVANAADKAAPATAAKMPTCGQMMSDKSVLPAKMAETMTAVADMMDAHAAFMMNAKSKEATAEADGMKKLAAQHREIAAMYTKTAESMKSAANWPAAQHDMTKMMADPKIQESMKKVLSTHKDMVALMQKEIAMMETPAKTN